VTAAREKHDPQRGGVQQRAKEQLAGQQADVVRRADELLPGGHLAKEAQPEGLEGGVHHEQAEQQKCRRDKGIPDQAAA
jgi:hypothetical protein